MQMNICVYRPQEQASNTICKRFKGQEPAHVRDVRYGAYALQIIKNSLTKQYIHPLFYHINQKIKKHNSTITQSLNQHSIWGLLCPDIQVWTGDSLYAPLC